MAYMSAKDTPPLPRSARSLLGLLRAGIPEQSPRTARAIQAPAPARSDDPPQPLSAEGLEEVAKNWRSRGEDNQERADTVAQALESLAEHRRATEAEAEAAEAPLSRARQIGQRISEFMRL